TAQSLTFIELSLSAMFDTPPRPRRQERLHIEPAPRPAFFEDVRGSSPIFAPVGFRLTPTGLVAGLIRQVPASLPSLDLKRHVIETYIVSATTLAVWPASD